MRQLLGTVAFVIIGAISVSAQSAAEQSESPQATMDNFLTAIVNGELQTAKGWEQGNAFFVHPASMPKHQPLIVIGMDYSTQPIWQTGNHAEVLVTYRELGRIDSSLRFHQPLASARPISVRYELIRVGTSATVGAAKGSAPRQWRIQNPQRFIWTGSSAAAQYVSQARASTNNAVTKKNADRTLSQLRKLK